MIPSSAIRVPRRADPYRDTDVIDARAPRFNQTVIAVGASLAVLLGWWLLLAVLAAQLAIGLRFGRRYCVPCLAYFELIQPRFGEGPIEDARPPRFANVIGAAVLGTAALAYAAGLNVLGAALGLLVTVLAALAALTGFCVGCELYRLGAFLWGRRSRRLERIDPTDVAGMMQGAVIEFTHPLCTECSSLRARLQGAGESVVCVDVSSRPELGRKYGVAVVPLAVRVDARGHVIERLAG